MKPTARVYDFVVVLKNKNKKAVRLTGILLSLLALFLFLYRSFQDTGSMMNLVAFFILLVLFSWSIFQLRKNEKVVFSPYWVLQVSGLLFYSLSTGWALFTWQWRHWNDTQCCHRK